MSECDGGCPEHTCLSCANDLAFKLQARIDAMEKELAPLEGRSVLDTVKYVAHLESRVVALEAEK